jgi:hypothetical protein
MHIVVILGKEAALVTLPTPKFWNRPIGQRLFRGHEGQKGRFFSEFPYQRASALLHHPLAAALLRVKFVVAVAAHLPACPCGIQFELLLRQFPPAIPADHILVKHYSSLFTFHFSLL